MYEYQSEESSFQFTWESIAALCASDPQFRDLISVRRIQANRLLAHARKPLAHPIVIMSGRVHVEAFDGHQEELQKAERRKLFAMPFTAGALLSPDLFADWPTYNVKTVDSTIVCYLLVDLVTIGEKWSEVLEALLQSQITVQQQLYAEQLEAYEPVRTRLARLLMRESQSGQSPITMSHKAIAELLGTYRETVSNQLARLKNIGVIDYGYRAIQVLDAERLGALTFTYDAQI